MHSGQHITVIIPALNEAASIGRVIGEIPNFVDRIIVVDNGSEDDTAGVAEAAGATVVVEPKRGYGAACLSGIMAAEQSDLIAFIDGDYSDYPAELEKVIVPVANQQCSFAIGCRRYSADGENEIPFHQRWGNWFACYFIGFLYGYRYRDMGPMRCITRELLEQLDMTDQNYGWTAEMQIKVCQRGEKVVQVPVRYRQRIGKSKISGTVKGSIMAGYKILYWTCRLFFKGNRVLKAG